MDTRSPSRVPAAGAKPAPAPAGAPMWKRVLHRAKADDLAGQAAKVAYYFFLSLPPAVMALFGLTGLFGGARTGDWLTGRLTTSLPREASALVTGFVEDVVHREAPGPLSIGLLLALWAGSNVFTALEDALNRAYGARLLQRDLRAAGDGHRPAAVDVRHLARHPARRRRGLGDGAHGVGACPGFPFPEASTLIS